MYLLRAIIVLLTSVINRLDLTNDLVFLYSTIRICNVVGLKLVSYSKFLLHFGI